MNSGSGDSEAHRALLRARRRIRDLSRDDAVTGLLNASAFRDVLSHDWAVAAREQGALALIAFTIDNFDDYIKVFGRHAADSCLRRVAQAVRRCLRRASDVCGRLPHDGQDVMMVLFHASDEASLTEFGDNIAREVRGLGLHHPHSKTSRFVTVSYKTALATAHGGEPEAERFLNSAAGSLHHSMNGTMVGAEARPGGLFQGRAGQGRPAQSVQGRIHSVPEKPLPGAAPSPTTAAKRS
ncbi:MAG: diguanylate cyclase [Woeseiaceae bacterium]|nr:diguanylate cyclase [Woeseiaceae bacterium]